ncbi:MAG: hypothetical protein R3F61_34890 [Myxococcota bacterium]
MSSASRGLLALAVGFALACGGMVDSAKQSANRRVEEAKQRAVDEIKREVTKVVEREILEAMAEQGLDAELFEITDDGFAVKTDALELRSGEHAVMPTDFPVGLPAGATLTTAGSQAAEDRRTVFVLASLTEREGVLDALIAEVTANGWVVAELPDAANADVQMRTFTKGDEKLVVFVQDDGQLVLAWVSETPAP